MSARSRSLFSVLLWSTVAVASAAALGAALTAGAMSLSYGSTAGALFGLVLGSVGTLRHVTGRTRGALAGVSRRDVAFASSFAIVTAVGWCAL